MKLIVTYIHEDRTTTRDYGEFIAHRVFEERGRKHYAFEFEAYEVEWSAPVASSFEIVGNEARIVIDWTK